MGVAKVRFLLRATPLVFLEGNLTGGVFRASGRILLTSTSINEGVSGSLKSYFGSACRNDLLARCERLYHKTIVGIQAKKRIPSEGYRDGLGVYCIGAISPKQVFNFCESICLLS